jgi:hypothetical protein
MHFVGGKAAFYQWKRPVVTPALACRRYFGRDALK